MCLEKGLIQSIKVKSNKTHLTIAFFHDLLNIVCSKECLHFDTPIVKVVVVECWNLKRCHTTICHGLSENLKILTARLSLTPPKTLRGDLTLQLTEFIDLKKFFLMWKISQNRNHRAYSKIKITNNLSLIPLC